MSTASVSRQRARRSAWLGLAVMLLGLVALALPAAADEGPVRHTVLAQEDGTTVEILSVDGYLDPAVARTITRLLEDVQGRDSALVVLQVDGPGALSADVGNVLEAMAASTIPVVVFVAPQQGIEARAGGGYAAMVLQADYSAAASVASIGPVLPLDLAGRDDAGVVDGVVVPDALADGQVLDAVAAADAGVVDVVADNVVTLLAELDGRTIATASGDVTLSLPREELTTRLHALGLLDRLLHAASAPAFIYLLLVLGLGVIGFEWFQPGFGVAGFAGLVMLPFAVVGLTILPVVWWALALLLLGLVLWHLDAALAGLGPLTLAATTAFAIGSWFLFDTGVLRVPAGVVVTMTISALAWFVVVLTIILRAQAGPEGVEVGDLVGRHGIVRSVLNPEGHVYLDDALWRARSGDGTRLKVGAPISVTDVDGAVLLVAPFDPDRQPAAG